MKQGTFKNAQITALGHAGFIVEIADKKLRFAFDPYDFSGDYEPVDYIFVSHPHYDHCDPNAIRKLLKDKTKIIAPACCKGELVEFGEQVEAVGDEEKHSTSHFTYWTLPAYNTNKFRTPTEVFHPRELGGVGFVVELAEAGGKNLRFYHAGDTDFTPEMAELKKVDVAFLPISGTFVMTLEEAMQAAIALEPKVVIPMHFGKILGSTAEATRFQNLLQGKVEVTVLSTVDY